MKALRWLLFPVSLLYGLVTHLRNKCYDWKIFSSYEIPGKSILVGNLSVGGTGKTPHVDYLIQHFLEQNVQLTTLSRGYGRASKGVQIASIDSTSGEVGDEALQSKIKYGDRIHVVVAEKRIEGIHQIQTKFPENELILLDDAFQHRAISAGLNLLITPYNDLFMNDFMLPTGNLREWKIGRKRADLIIVSKSPYDLSTEAMNAIKNRLRFDHDRIFFSHINYGSLISFTHQPTSYIEHVLLVTGIGNPTPLVEYWKTRANVTHIAFPDHHNFTAANIRAIHEKFDTFAKHDRAIITTEKDFMRLRKFQTVFDVEYAWYYQPISIEISNQHRFNNHLDEYFR